MGVFSQSHDFAQWLEYEQWRAMRHAIRGVDSWEVGMIYVARVSMLFWIVNSFRINQLALPLIVSTIKAIVLNIQLESFYFTSLPVLTLIHSKMLFRTLLFFIFTSLSIAVAVPPTASNEQLRAQAAAMCDNLCNRSGKPALNVLFLWTQS